MINEEEIGKRIKDIRVKNNLTQATFAESLKLANFSWDNRYTYTPAEGENLDLFNLLMPYAVSEQTTYSHISVSYASGTDSEFGTCFETSIYVYDNTTNCYQRWNFLTDDSQTSGKTAYERIVEAVKKGDFRVTNPTNKEMISGDIMLEMDENQNFYEISPNLETEKI